MADENAPAAEAPAQLTSKTIVLVGHGGYDKLKIQQNDRPSPGKDQVLVNVKATGVNFSELMCRAGMYDRCPKLPAVLGWEGAGVITEVGEGVDQFTVSFIFILCHTSCLVHLYFLFSLSFMQFSNPFNKETYKSCTCKLW